MPSQALLHAVGADRPLITESRRAADSSLWAEERWQMRPHGIAANAPELEHHRRAPATCTLSHGATNRLSVIMSKPTFAK